MKYATHIRNKYLRNRTMQNTSNISGGKLASIIWNNSEIKDSFCSLIVWHVKFNLLFKTSLNFILHQLFWIILSSKKGAVGCECQVDSLLDQSFYMGSQTKDLYSATRPRHFLLLRSISSSSRKKALVFEEQDKLPDGTLNYKRQGQWHKYSQHLYSLEK